MKSELPSQLKKLNELVKQIENSLETKNIRITALEHGTKINQFFSNNVPGIVASCQALLRGEPTERHELRLEREFKSVFDNLNKIKELEGLKEFSENLNEIESILNQLNKIYKEI